MGAQGGMRNRVHAAAGVLVRCRVRCRVPCSVTACMISTLHLQLGLRVQTLDCAQACQLTRIACLKAHMICLQPNCLKSCLCRLLRMCCASQRPRTELPGVFSSTPCADPVHQYFPCPLFPCAEHALNTAVCAVAHRHRSTPSRLLDRDPACNIPANACMRQMSGCCPIQAAHQLGSVRMTAVTRRARCACRSPRRAPPARRQTPCPQTRTASESSSWRGAAARARRHTTRGGTRRG